MQSIVSIVMIVGMLASAASAVPVNKRQQQSAPYSVISPTDSSTIFSGHNTVISWIPGEEDHISIDLAPVFTTVGAQIAVAQDVSSANGTYIINVPDVTENCARWKIGVIHNKQSVWSDPVYISTNGTSCYTPAATTEAAGPRPSMAAEQAGGAVMSASIDILGPDGQPVDGSSSSGTTRHVSFNTASAFAFGTLTLAVALAL